MKRDPKEHWAYKPVAVADVPRPVDRAWARSDVDRFIRAAQ